MGRSAARVRDRVLLERLGSMGRPGFVRDERVGSQWKTLLRSVNGTTPPTQCSPGPQGVGPWVRHRGLDRTDSGGCVVRLSPRPSPGGVK